MQKFSVSQHAHRARLRLMTVYVLAALAISSSAGCSPGMHKAYQTTMGGVALAGWGTASYLTYKAVNDPSENYRETNVLLGDHPGAVRLIGADIFNVALVIGIRLIPDRWFDAGDADWVRDGLMTCAAIAGASDGYGDYKLTH